MSLVSPGVQVTIVDQSQYLSGATNSVPFVLLATAANKTNPNSPGTVAVGTIPANANKLTLVTSQTDLVSLFGNPFFYNSTNGTPINGYELNEYGLLAAYYALGLTNQIYVIRAAIDLAALIGSVSRPVGSPTNGAWWLNAASSTWGINEWNAVTNTFSVQSPIVINSEDADNLISGGFPISSIGSIGDYAVIATPITSGPAYADGQQFFYKAPTNSWVSLGSPGWLAAVPTLQSSISNPVLTPGYNLILNLVIDSALPDSGEVVITVPDSPNNTVNGIAGVINALGWNGLAAQVIDGRLALFNSAFNPAGQSYLAVTAGGNGTLLNQLGITAGDYYQPQFVYGTSAQQPLWQSSQAQPAPSGSIWIKVGSSGNGLLPVVSRWNSATSTWQSKIVTLATSDWTATAATDSTGGQAIPAGSVYAQYNFDLPAVDGTNPGPVYLWTKTSTGPTIATGSAVAPTFTFASGNTATIYVSEPSSNVLMAYTMNLQNVTNASSFITQWYASGVLYTTATVNTQGSIVLTHTTGGVIVVDDINPATGTSFELMSGAGFVSNTTPNVKNGPSPSLTFNATQTTTTGSGTGLAMDVTNVYGSYFLSNTYFTNAGAGYLVGDSVTFSGTQLGGGTSLVVKVAAITSVPTFNAITNAGTGYVDDSYTNVPTTGGTGVGLTVNYTAAGGVVTVVSVNNGGVGYLNGDTITIPAPTGSDFATFTITITAGAVSAVQWVSGTANVPYATQISNWVPLYPAYTASTGAPYNIPVNDTSWYYSDPTQVDIMVNTLGGWVGYGNTNYDSNGFPTSGSNTTDPNGPIVAFSAPTTQSTGNPLAYGDIWIDTADLTMYPLVNRWQNYEGMDQWVLIDNTDQVNSHGIIFQDARWATSGAVNPAIDPIPTIQSLLTSDYLDLDAPLPQLYPIGMLLWNTRRSGYNVKQFRKNYFTSASYPNAMPYNPSDPTNTANLPEVSYTWVTASGNMENGAPYMGSYAQRAMVVKSLRAAIETNTDIRDEDNYFNLQACPNYPELQPDMVVLNADRGDTSYILGDTPMTLPNDANALVGWARNTAGAASTGIQGCVTRNTYLGLFYPSGLSVDLAGNQVAVPPSHMMLSTFLHNDQVAYPWLAAAGTRRGIINNATSIGYVNAQTGAFISIKTSLGIRDVLYENNINPLVFFTGQGLLNYGNITSFASSSALDRTNVARLICYIRRQLTLAARPFVFEPNDSITQKAIAGVIQSFFVTLVAHRGIYDYLVVCDSSNNTPARIDRNELWVDCAIEPVKAAEFIYIPVRVLATGTIGNQV
jgi:hypothetical protein